MADEFQDGDDEDDGYDEKWKPCTFHFEFTEAEAQKKKNFVDEEDGLHSCISQECLACLK